jgi:hypothetical protein
VAVVVDRLENALMQYIFELDVPDLDSLILELKQLG